MNYAYKQDTVSCEVATLKPNRRRGFLRVEQTIKATVSRFIYLFAMGNVFAQKPLKEIVRENQRMIKKSIRELEKEIKTLENNEKKLIADIKKHAKLNQMVIR